MMRFSYTYILYFFVLNLFDKKLVSKAIGFLTVVVKPARHRAMFENPTVLRSFCEKIILPNMTLRGIVNQPDIYSINDEVNYRF